MCFLKSCLGLTLSSSTIPVNLAPLLQTKSLKKTLTSYVCSPTDLLGIDAKRGFAGRRKRTRKSHALSFTLTVNIL